MTLPCPAPPHPNPLLHRRTWGPSGIYIYIHILCIQIIVDRMMVSDKLQDLIPGHPLVKSYLLIDYLLLLTETGETSPDQPQTWCTDRSRSRKASTLNIFKPTEVDQHQFFTKKAWFVKTKGYWYSTFGNQRTRCQSGLSRSVWSTNDRNRSSSVAADSFSSRCCSADTSGLGWASYPEKKSQPGSGPETAPCWISWIWVL